MILLPQAHFISIIKIFNKIIFNLYYFYKFYDNSNCISITVFKDAIQDETNIRALSAILFSFKIILPLYNPKLE